MFPNVFGLLRRPRRAPPTALTTILLVTLSALNIAFIFHRSRPHDHAYSYVGHDFPQTLPLPGPLPLVAMTVEETSRYPLLGSASDAEWLSLTPKSAEYGYVRLGPEQRLFAVAMFHQLHCLRYINLAFEPSLKGLGGHVQHCLNYLRQAALCAADTTLELGDFALRNFDEERIGSTHTCRDWSVVYEELQRNKAAWEASDFPPPPPLSKRSNTVPKLRQSHSTSLTPKWALPPLDRVYLTMDSSIHYTLSSDDSDAVWNSTLPSGGGLLHYDRDDDHRRDDKDDKDGVFSIAMFHQIRCIDLIRREIVHRQAHRDSNNIPLPSNELAHHCMNYLRQMILCHSDLRLQSVRKEHGQGITASYVTHTCNDWSVVYDAAEENHKRREQRLGQQKLL